MNRQQALDLLLVEPPLGSVVKLRVAYDGSPKVYSYAVIEGGGRWYITGQDGGSGPLSWAELVDWLEVRGVDIVSIEMATAWEGLL